MIMFSTWTTYTVCEGDSLASIATQHNMFDSILVRHNPSLKSGRLVPGMKLKVKNRPFLEKNYFNKLKDVLDIVMEKRKYILPSSSA